MHLPNSPEPRKGAVPRLRTASRRAARTGLLAFVGFWTWFIGSVMASEGAAAEPVTALAALWLTGVLAWWWPRPGAVALLVLGGSSLWFFADPTGRWNAATWLIVLPACVLALGVWAGAPRHARRAASATSRS